MEVGRRVLVVAALLGAVLLTPGSAVGATVWNQAATCSSYYAGGYECYRALEGNSGSWAVGNSGTEAGQWLLITFPETCVSSIALTDRGLGAAGYVVETEGQSVTEGSLTGSGSRTTTLDGSRTTFVAVQYTGSVSGDGGWESAVLVRTTCTPAGGSGGGGEVTVAEFVGGALGTMQLGQAIQLGGIAVSVILLAIIAVTTGLRR